MGASVNETLVNIQLSPTQKECYKYILQGGRRYDNVPNSKHQAIRLIAKVIRMLSAFVSKYLPFHTY